MREVGIQNLQSKVKLDKKKILKCARYALKAMAEEKAELSLVFVDDAYIKNLNRKYRDADFATDVLAFPLRESEGPGVRDSILGDVVISIETAEREARIRKIHLQEEVDLYVVHGILHLLGYDDEKRGSRSKMRSMEKKILGGKCSGRT